MRWQREGKSSVFKPLIRRLNDNFSANGSAGLTQIMTPEEKARQQIDLLLQQSGRIVHGRSQINLAAGPGVAICEAMLKTSETDYLSFAAAHLKNAHKEI